MTTELPPAGTVHPASVARWTDRKRYLWLIGLVAPSLTGIALLGWSLTGKGLWLWAGPIFVFGIVPLLDLVMGLDPSNPPDEVIEALENDRYYRWVTYAYIPLQYAGFLAGMWVIATKDLGPLGTIGLSITIGLVGGIGINTAHELGHKRPEHERWLAKIALAQTAYGHFFIEHNRGHHVRVATAEDPASARFGEHLYGFWWRTVLGSARSAWRLEKRRLARSGQHPWRLSNDNLNAWLMTVALWSGLLLWLGWRIVPALLLQAVVGILLLEVVNYLEHYGMLRQQIRRGDRLVYERVDPRHSWNSNNLVTNLLLYHLQRHSDHHAHPVRRYQVLRHYEESPALPTGYAGMILLALLPPVWRRVMDRRVLSHVGGDMSRVNVHPRARAQMAVTGPSVGPVEPGGPGSAVEVTASAASAGVGTLVVAARCPGCGYRYDVAQGDPREGLPAGTPWSRVDPDLECPDCGVRTAGEFVLERLGRPKEPGDSLRPLRPGCAAPPHRAR